MVMYKRVTNKATNQTYIETKLQGKGLLTLPQLNKGTAFTEKERNELCLKGKLPDKIETIEEQANRVYLQYLSYEDGIKRNIFLNNLHNNNQTLFYYLVNKHLEEMLPIIYTPVIGTTAKDFSREFRHPRGLYISANDIDQIDSILDNRSNPDIDVIVVTDGEAILGIGDQGIGGMDIPVAKLMVYSLCAGIDHLNTLPIMLDVGTDNPYLLDDPLYLGLRKKRLTGKAYDQFIKKFIDAIKPQFPNVFLHWEDFGRVNAFNNLKYYRQELCSFNDDIQGTAVVTIAAILSAVKQKQQTLNEQRIVIYGAGTAGTGVAEQIQQAMIQFGVSIDDAKSKLWLLDKQGLLLDSMDDLTDAQKPFTRPHAELTQFKATNAPGLMDVIKTVKPTILIGCSAQKSAFNQEIIEQLLANEARPIILPLSNPTTKAEATPADLFRWTNGQAIIATGSPFPPVDYNKQQFTISQCNNALAFPGIGLGIIACKATELTNEMLWEAAKTLSEVKIEQPGAILPSINQAKHISRKIALSVIQKAQEQKLATLNDQAEHLLDSIIWEPKYIPYHSAEPSSE